MTLVLSTLRCPDRVAPETRRVTGGEFAVGRGPDNDWVLPDPDRHLSKRHCVFAFRSGGWQVADTSTNGTFFNRESQPIGDGGVRELRDGDRVTFGPYEIEIRVEAEQAGASSGFSGLGAGGQRGGADPFASPFADNVFAPPPPAPPPFGEDPLLAQKHAPGSAHLPADFDPFATPSRDDAMGFPTQADHSPAFGDAFRPPKAVHSIPDDWDLGIGNPPAAPSQPSWQAGPPPADPFDFGAPARGAPAADQATAWQAQPQQGWPPALPPAASPSPASPPPASSGDPFGFAAPGGFGAAPGAAAGQAGHAGAAFGQALPPGGLPLGAPPPPPSADHAGASAFAQGAGASPFDAAPSQTSGPAMPMASFTHAERGGEFSTPAQVVAPAAFAGDAPRPQATQFEVAPHGMPPLDPVPLTSSGSPAPASGSPFDEASVASTTSTPPPAMPLQSANVAGASGDLLAAFLHGAGMTGATPSDPKATMLELGRAFRALVAGLRETLIARAAIKGEFRIEQTMIRSRGNNPLKFSAGDDDALSALLGIGRRIDMAPSAAVADALRDIRLHELASMAAMQTAVRALLARLDPEPLRRQADAAGGLTLVPAQKKARAWDAFEALHGQISEALSDDFDSVFGRAFARAYEQALEDVARAERKGGAG